MGERTKKLRKRTLTDQEVIKLYVKGKSTTEIGKCANVSSRYVRMVLHKHNVEMRSFGSWKRKYSMNEDYFKTWSNNMAYILGFFVADGTVARDMQSISFAQKEKYILEDIRKEIGSEQPIYKNMKTGVHLLTLSSKIMKEDIMTIHGVMPNKSSQIKFPEVPKEYMSHFIRGYFDGDGSISYEKYTVTFVGGSEIFMKSLLKILTSEGFRPQFVSQGSYYRVHIRGRRSIKLFSNWIYKNTDKSFYLRRKFNNFNKEKLKLEYLEDRKDLSTRKAVSTRKLDFLLIYTQLKSEQKVCDCMGIKITTFKRWLKNDKRFKLDFINLSKL